MKHRKLIYKIALSIVLGLFFTGLSAQDFSERMVYEGHYAAPEGSTLELSNKYGDIHLMTWDSDSVFISTELILTSTSHESLRKLIKNVKIKYDERDERIIAYTSFNDNASEILNQLQEFTKSIIPNQVKRIEANYTIYVPKHISLKIKNQYGDVSLDDIMGNVDIDLFNGAMSANRLMGASSFDLRYAKASINQINDGVFNLFYSDIELNKAISVDVKSKLSEYRINEVGVCRIASTRDDIRLDQVSYLYGDASYSKIDVEYIINEIDADLNYGKIQVDDVDAQCTGIDIHSDRTDVTVYIPQDLAYKYSLLYHPDAFVHLPMKTTALEVDKNGEVYLEVRGETQSNAILELEVKAIRRCFVKIQNAL